MRTIFILMCAYILAACGPVAEYRRTDQCLRAQIFQQCLAAVPKGPERVYNNDWDEVVGACESAAYYQSLRITSVIKKECQ